MKEKNNVIWGLFTRTTSDPDWLFHSAYWSRQMAIAMKFDRIRIDGVETECESTVVKLHASIANKSGKVSHFF